MDDLEWIREGLRRSGKSRVALAEALGRAPSAITSLLGPEKPSERKVRSSKQGRHAKPRQLKSHEVSIIAKFLGIEPPEAYNQRRVPVMFACKQTAAPALLEKIGPQEHREIAVTEGDTSSVAALGLKGGSMLGMKDGTWLFFFGEEVANDLSALNEHLCVCYLSRNEVIVGTLRPSRYDGRFDILDFLERKDYLAQEIVRAAPIMAMVPPPISESYLDGEPSHAAPGILKIRKAP
ncbi:MAG: hypothetical protein WAP03_13275 [Methylorubrum rhodinum]|uniref:hypothetical protein n=1 Tax=Methylorubrum rhodinum TaxID=29428 RepID=UPI003BAF1FB9